MQEIPVGVDVCGNGGQLKVEVGGWRAWFQPYKLQLAWFSDESSGGETPHDSRPAGSK